MSEKKYKNHGEYIDLMNFEGYVVKGHIEIDEFKSIVTNDMKEEVLNHNKIEHCYARWVGDWSTGEYERGLDFNNKPEMGNFPVTVWEVKP